MRYVVLLCIVLFPVTAYGQKVIWYKGKKSMVYTKDEHTRLLKKLEAGDGAIKKVKLYEQRLQQTKVRQKVFDERTRLWKQERTLQDKKDGIHSTLYKNLQNQILVSTRALERKDKHILQLKKDLSKAHNSILRSPILWFTIGVATAAVVTVAIKLAMDNKS